MINNNFNRTMNAYLVCKKGVFRFACGRLNAVLPSLA